MKLSLEEFNRIRPVQWHLINYGKRVYNTTINQTETQLFWLDFMSLVFAPKFKAQHGIPLIADFDITQHVLITDDLTLVLPTPLETAMYFANNLDGAPVEFAINIKQLTVLIISILAIVAVLVGEHYIGKKIHFQRII